MTLRPMEPADARVVAALHAASWRSAYRDVLSARYLEHDVDADRLALWTARLSDAEARQFGIVAESDGAAVGFAFVMEAADDQFDYLLDNLHVSEAMRGRGVGQMLLAATARELLARRDAQVPARSPPVGLALWVFDANAGARRFYERLGAVAVNDAWKDMPDGGRPRAWRYAWDDVTALARGVDGATLGAAAIITPSPTRSMSDDAAISAAEDALRTAMLANDVATLDRLLDDALMFTALDGTVVGKEDDLAAHRARRLRLTRFDVLDRRTVHCGSTVVVSVAVDHEGTWDGAPVSGRLRYTRVWCERPDGWRIVAGHMSVIP